VSAPGSSDFGIGGEITTECAIQRGVRALVTSCGVRDVEAIAALGFPVFARTHTIQGTVKRYAGKHEVPVRIGSAIIHHGDWIVCDADGCVVIRAAHVEEVASAAAERGRLSGRRSRPFARARRPAGPSVFPDQPVQLPTRSRSAFTTSTSCFSRASSRA
jgi:regulator of RNase E activity RraA